MDSRVRLFLVLFRISPSSRHLVISLQLGACGGSTHSQTLQTLLRLGNRALPSWEAGVPIFCWYFVEVSTAKQALCCQTIPLSRGNRLFLDHRFSPCLLVVLVNTAPVVSCPGYVEGIKKLRELAAHCSSNLKVSKQSTFFLPFRGFLCWFAVLYPVLQLLEEGLRGKRLLHLGETWYPFFHHFFFVPLCENDCINCISVNKPVLIPKNVLGIIHSGKSNIILYLLCITKF